MDDKKPPVRTGRSSATALVVEPVEILRRLFTSQLTFLGLKTIEASEPAAAREILRNADPAIDLLMIGLDVRHAIERADFACEVRRAYPGTAVLVTAGYLDAQIQATLAVEGIDVLTKPVRIRELARRVRTALGDRGDSP